MLSEWTWTIWKEHIDPPPPCVNIHCHGSRAELLSIWAETLSIVCFVTGVFCGFRKVLLWDRQGLQTPPVFDQYCLLCALTPRCRCDRVWSNGTVGLFVLLCCKVFKSPTLYDEFWINLSFGRRLPSGALLEWWTGLCGPSFTACGFIHLKHRTVTWEIELISAGSNFLSFPSDSCLMFGLSMTNALLPALLLSLCFSDAAALSQRRWECGLEKRNRWRLVWLQDQTAEGLNHSAPSLFWNRTTDRDGTPGDHPGWEEGPAGGSQSQRTEWRWWKVRWCTLMYLGPLPLC